MKFTPKQLLQAYVFRFGGIIVALIGYVVLRKYGTTNSLNSLIGGIVIGVIYYAVFGQFFLKRISAGTK